MWKSLKFAKDIFFLNLRAELNGSNIVIKLNNHQQSIYYVVLIFEDCIDFNVYFRILNFLHIKRKINQIAHYLAKYALYNLRLYLD
jgi:hypothetical protein